MKIEYDNIMDDLLNFSEHHSMNSPRIKKKMSVFKYTFPILVLIIIIPVIITNPTKNITIWFVVSVIWFFAAPYYYRYAIRRSSLKMYNEGENKGVLTKHTLILNEEGIIEETNYNTTKLKWDSIEKIVKDYRYIYIYIGAVSAFIVPIRSFSSSISFNDFYHELIKLKYNA